jgi:hypothetical protein
MGDGDVGVPEALADDPGRDPGGQGGGGVAVADIMQPNLRESGSAGVLLEPLGEPLGVQWPAVGPGEHQPGVLPTWADRQPLLELPAPVLAECGNGGRVESDRAVVLGGLWFADKDLVVDDHPRAPRRDTSCFQVNVGPTESSYLSLGRALGTWAARCGGSGPGSAGRPPGHHRGDGLARAQVGVGDDQLLHLSQPTGLQTAKERRPEGPVLAVADGEAEHLAAPIPAHPSGHHHRLGDHPAVDPCFESGRSALRAAAPPGEGAPAPSAGELASTASGLLGLGCRPRPRWRADPGPPHRRRRPPCSRRC